MIELRVKTKRSDKWIAKVAGTAITSDMINIKLEGPAKVLRPDGKPLCVYLPGAILDLSNEMIDEFSTIRGMTNNRGYASGSERKVIPGRSRSYAQPIASSILGSFDPVGPNQFCRLTAFTAKEVDRWERLLPYFQRIAQLLEANVPDRFAAQAREAASTNPDWIIEGTPFTTITVNNSYPTGIHTDKGDLDAGFSTLACMRRGDFSGGWLTFPQYGVAADMQHGDVLLMDAHDWHGNTPITCDRCGENVRKFDHVCAGVDPKHDADFASPERISVVSYFRTEMVHCGSLAEENDRRLANRERRAAGALGLNAQSEEGA